MDRGTFLLTALSKEGCSYVWGAKGPDEFDCSGLVTFCLREAGFSDWQSLFSADEIKAAGVNTRNWEQFTNAQRLYNKLNSVAQPKPGDLAFYGSGSSHITHIVICTGDGRIIGANGGNSTTVKPTPNACVKYRRAPDYRPDLRGFRSLPCP